MRTGNHVAERRPTRGTAQWWAGARQPCRRDVTPLTRLSHPTALLATLIDLPVLTLRAYERSSNIMTHALTSCNNGHAETLQTRGCLAQELRGRRPDEFGEVRSAETGKLV